MKQKRFNFSVHHPTFLQVWTHITSKECFDLIKQANEWKTPWTMLPVK
jgi:hypothetical protein